MNIITLGNDVWGLIQQAIDTTGIEQGIIGVKVPRMGIEESCEFHEGVFYIQDNNPELNFAYLPTPNMDHFKSVQDNYAALARRVERDGLDGVRYNRIFIAVYQEVNVPEVVVKAHDIFLDITSPAYSSYRCVMTVKDNK